jgi:hypothetical protein
MDLFKSIMKAIEEMEPFSESDVVYFYIGEEEYMGTIEHVMTDGYFGVPGSKFYTQVSADNPAVLIRIWLDGEESEFMVGRMANEVEKKTEEDQEDLLEEEDDDIEVAASSVLKRFQKLL